MKKIKLVIGLVVLSCLSSAAKDSTHVSLSYHASATAAYMMPDGKVDVYSPGIALGAKLAIDMRPQRHIQGLSDWNEASVGVGLDYLNMGNSQWLGHIIAPYTFMRVPLVRLNHFELGVRPGVGIAISTKTYGNTIPAADKYQYLYQKDGEIIANQCIGSYLNVYLAEALYMEFPIANGFSVLASGGWYHISNGSTIQPNSGYNLFAAELGVRYTPAATREAEKEAYTCDGNLRKGPKKLGLYEGKRWDVELSGSGGYRQVYYKDQRGFGVASISLAAHYRPWAIFKLGGGLDVFYDGAYTNRETQFGKTELSLATPADCWRVGISLQPEFVVGDFSAGFHFGAYMYDGVKNLEASNEEEQEQLKSGERLQKPIFYSYDLLKAGSAGHPDGWFYTRILLKYRPTDHFFVQFGLKAHLTKAEFIDLGVGVCL